MRRTDGFLNISLSQLFSSQAFQNNLQIRQIHPIVAKQFEILRKMYACKEWSEIKS